MKRYGLLALMVMLALLPVGGAEAQEHTVHRNIGLDGTEQQKQHHQTQGRK